MLGSTLHTRLRTLQTWYTRSLAAPQEWRFEDKVDTTHLKWLALKSREGRTRCDMAVYLRRNPLVYLVKQATLDLLLVRYSTVI